MLYPYALYQVNYINAHATSTLVGDVAEVNAVKKVFTDTSHLKMNGTKSMIGHCLGAAGGLEAVACIQAIRTGWLHPTINQARNLCRIAPFVGCLVHSDKCSSLCGVPRSRHTGTGLPCCVHLHTAGLFRSHCHAMVRTCR